MLNFKKQERYNSLDNFFFFEGFKCHTSFEFGCQLSSFSFHVRGRISGLIPLTTSPFHQHGSGSVWRGHFTISNGCLVVLECSCFCCLLLSLIERREHLSNEDYLKSPELHLLLVVWRLWGLLVGHNYTQKLLQIVCP